MQGNILNAGQHFKLWINCNIAYIKIPVCKIVNSRSVNGYQWVVTGNVELGRFATHVNMKCGSLFEELNIFAVHQGHCCAQQWVCEVPLRTHREHLSTPSVNLILLLLSTTFIVATSSKLIRPQSCHGNALFNMPLSIAAWSCFDYTGSSVMTWWQQLCRNHRSPLCCSPVTTSSGQSWEFEEHLWGEKVWTGQKMGWLRFLASAQAATSSPLQLAWSHAGRNAALSLAGQSASCVLIGWAGLERALLCASAANTPEHTPVFRRSTPLWHRIIACA